MAVWEHHGDTVGTLWRRRGDTLGTPRWPPGFNPFPNPIVFVIPEQIRARRREVTVTSPVSPPQVTSPDTGTRPGVALGTVPVPERLFREKLEFPAKVGMGRGDKPGPPGVPSLGDKPCDVTVPVTRTQPGLWGSLGMRIPGF